MQEYSNEVFTKVFGWETKIILIQTKKTVTTIQSLQVHFNFQNPEVIRKQGIPENKMGLSDCCSKGKEKEKVLLHSLTWICYS